MKTTPLADAKARPSKPADQVEARASIDAATLQALTATQPPQPQDAADLVRSMRDRDRY